MVADVPPFSDPDRDAFLNALENNALARWWRARAGASGETGARVIAREWPLRQAEASRTETPGEEPFPA